jgi:hypothetical protein
MDDDVELVVHVNGEYGSFSAGMKVPQLYRREFEPLRTCDDATMTYITGDNLAGSIQAMSRIKARKDAAEILANELAKHIVRAMQQNDTHNGYAKE